MRIIINKNVTRTVIDQHGRSVRGHPHACGRSQAEREQQCRAEEGCTGAGSRHACGIGRKDPAL